MLLIIVARYGTAYILIMRVVIVIDIMYLMAVVVVLQIGTYVSLIVTEVVRGMMTVVTGEMIPIVR